MTLEQPTLLSSTSRGRRRAPEQPPIRDWTAYGTSWSANRSGSRISYPKRGLVAIAPCNQRGRTKKDQGRVKECTVRLSSLRTFGGHPTPPACPLSTHGRHGRRRHYGRVIVHTHSYPRIGTCASVNSLPLVEITVPHSPTQPIPHNNIVGWRLKRCDRGLVVVPPKPISPMLILVVVAPITQPRTWKHLPPPRPLLTWTDGTQN